MSVHLNLLCCSRETREPLEFIFTERLLHRHKDLSCCCCCCCCCFKQWAVNEALQQQLLPEGLFGCLCRYKIKTSTEGNPAAAVPAAAVASASAAVAFVSALAAAAAVAAACSGPTIEAEGLVNV